MKNKLRVFALIAFTSVLLLGCGKDEEVVIPDEPVVQPDSVGGSPVIPTRVEVIVPVITYEEAKSVAEQDCIKAGESLGEGSYNESSRTWWFDANLNEAKEGCNPACVVSEDKGVEINWRCTGLVTE